MPSAPYRPADDEARRLALALVARARHAALAVLDPEDGRPMISRIAFLAVAGAAPVSLVSSLAGHTRALRRVPECALLLGRIDGKGDPLTHPRLSLRAEARFVARGGADHVALRATWLEHLPKSKLYIDFADFSFVRFHPSGAELNGGFGKAFRLNRADLAPVMSLDTEGQ